MKVLHFFLLTFVFTAILEINKENKSILDNTPNLIFGVTSKDCKTCHESTLFLKTIDEIVTRLNLSVAVCLINTDEIDASELISDDTENNVYLIRNFFNSSEVINTSDLTQLEALLKEFPFN